MNDIPDQLLICHILQGDSACFEVLCNRYYTSLQAVGYAVLMDRHLAEDVAQETLAYASQNLLKIRNPQKVGAWLRGICRNIAKDMLERQSRQKRQGEREESDWVSNENDGDDSGDLIRQAVSQLPLSLREVVVMRYFDDMSYRQMSKCLGLSQQAINGRLRRAKKKIEKYLKQTDLRGNIS
jgi:RNA polymerase sigma-70 factor (ECF subfamily)